jgi:hypothetical protein
MDDGIQISVSPVISDKPGTEVRNAKVREAITSLSTPV